MERNVAVDRALERLLEESDDYHGTPKRKAYGLGIRYAARSIQATIREVEVEAGT